MHDKKISYTYWNWQLVILFLIIFYNWDCHLIILILMNFYSFVNESCFLKWLLTSLFVKWDSTQIDFNSRISQQIVILFNIY